MCSIASLDQLSSSRRASRASALSCSWWATVDAPVGEASAITRAVSHGGAVLWVCGSTETLWKGQADCFRVFPVRARGPQQTNCLPRRGREV